MKVFEASIDGNDCKNLESFLESIGIALKFPEYYGKNMNALYDLISDLDWLSADEYILRIKHSNLFLSDEPGDVKDDVVKFLHDVEVEWRNVPNYKGEEAYRIKKTFLVLFE